MSDDTRERILDATERMLRRFGPTKTTVVDIARELGMSHANVYRFFESKATLFDAVAERWLARVAEPLQAIATAPAPAAERLVAWVVALHRQKRHKVVEDPEVLATFRAIAQATQDIVSPHVATLVSQLHQIIEDGVHAGEFKVSDPDVAVQAVMDATLAFHYPPLVAERAGLSDDVRASTVARMLAAALRTGVI